MGIMLIWSAVSMIASGERSIRIAKIRHAMMKIRIGALVSSVVRDHCF
jgi:hypothetical protein